MFKAKNYFKMFFTLFFCLTLFMVPITVYAQEGMEASSGETNHNILVDGCNMLTDKEETLIAQAQLDVYNETGVWVDIYGYDIPQVASQINENYSDAFSVVNYSDWADKYALPGRVTALYTMVDNYLFNGDIITCHVCYSDDISNVGDIVYERIRGLGPACDLYIDETSYVGFDVYYMLKHDILGENEEDILETWNNETEGNISPNFTPGETTVETTTTTVETTTETITENPEIVNTAPSHSIGDFLFLFIGVGLGLLCMIGGRVLFNYNENKVTETVHEKTPEINNTQEQIERTQEKAQVEKPKKVNEVLTPEEKILQRDYNRFVSQFERFKEFAKNEGIPESKLSPFTMKNGILEQIQDGIKHYHNIRIMSDAHDEDAKAIYAVINKNIQNGYEAIDIMKEHTEQFRSLEIQNSEKALKVVLEQRGIS